MILRKAFGDDHGGASSCSWAYDPAPEQLCIAPVLGAGQGGKRGQYQFPGSDAPTRQSHHSNRAKLFGEPGHASCRQPSKSCCAGKAGQGTRIAHHDELLQGVFEDDRGRLHRGLVTFPLDSLRSTAWIVLDDGGHLCVEPHSRVKALRATQLALEHLGHPTLGGRLVIKSDIPMGHEANSSILVLHFARIQWPVPTYRLSHPRRHWPPRSRLVHRDSEDSRRWLSIRTPAAAPCR